MSVRSFLAGIAASVCLLALAAWQVYRRSWEYGW